MGYYMVGRGDFYRSRGRGDPGFLSFLTGIGSAAASFIPGVGPIASKLIGGVGSAIEKVGAKPAVRSAVDLATKHPVLTAAGAAGAVGTAIGAHKLMGSRAGAGMGAAPAGGGGGGNGKRRRMNPYNPRALRRALRRTHSFAKMAMQIVRVSKRFKHPKRFRIGHFKKKSKR